MSSEGRARVGLSLLLLLTMFSFAQVFAEGDYPGPVLLGMIVAASLAIGARRLGLWTATTMCVSAVVLFLYLVVIFQARNSFYLLPTPGAVAGLGRSVGNALRHSSVDFAPVPVRAGYVILVVIGMWVATTIGEIATFRWRRPLLATLPCIGLFCIQMTVGTGTGGPVLALAFLLALLTFWGFEAAHRVRSWGRWVPAWQGREGREPESVTGALARRMSAGCVAAAVVAPLIVPALGDGLLAWRNEVGDSPFGSGGGSGEVNPLVSIAPQLIEQSDELLFTVESDKREYWRLVSLADFDGEEWRPVPGAEIDDVGDGGSFLGQSNGPKLAEPLEQTITFENLESARLPAAINPFDLSVPEGFGVSYDEENQDLVLSEEVDEDFSYTVTSNVPQVTFQGLREGVVDKGLPAVYLETTGASQRVRDLAAGFRVADGRRRSDGEFLIALQDYLRSAEFGYDASPEYVEAAGAGGGSVDYLEQFLFDLKAGYCQQFATAFALLARTEGIPTRVAVGFLPGAVDPNEGTFQVTGLNTHAWPEVYFEEYGWVRFDPTPRLEAPEPRYTRPPVELGGRGAGGAPGGVGAAAGRQPAGTTDPRLAGANTGVGGEFDRPLGDISGRPVPENPVWARAFDRIVAGVAVLLVLFLAAVPSLKTWRTRLRYRRARGADGTAAAAFAHFEAEAAELAAARGPAESAAAFAARLARLRKVPSEDAARLARIYEAAEYAPFGVRPDQARQAKVLAHELRGAMWARASWWARAARLFSPRGLVGRP